MDALGPAGCREHFDEIKAWLNDAAAKASWLDKLRAAGNALAAGLMIDPLDVAGSLVRIAIERAEHHIGSSENNARPIINSISNPP
jgi:hypothetical protein